MEPNELLNELNITFVRHGTTEYNEQNRIQGSSDIPLSKKGYEDIEKVVNLTHCNYDLLFSQSFNAFQRYFIRYFGKIWYYT